MNWISALKSQTAKGIFTLQFKFQCWFPKNQCWNTLYPLLSGALTVFSVCRICTKSTSKKIFQKYHQSVKQFVWPDLAPNFFAKIISTHWWHCLHGKNGNLNKLHQSCYKSVFLDCSSSTYGWLIFSSPEPKAHGWANSIPVTPASVRPSVVRPSVCQHFQTSSPLKPLGQLNSNFIWRLLRTRERKFVQMVLVTWPRWPPRPYMVKTL